MKKICVYTCITGEYDDLKNINKEKGIDYYCFTNNKKIKSDIWNIIYIEEKELSNIKLARKIKILGHDKINNKYDIIIWLDAAVIFKTKIMDFINKYFDEKYDLVAFKHGERNTIKEEAIECVKTGKETKENAKKILDLYKKEKFKDNNGLIESTVLIKTAKSKELEKTMKLWYNMILNYSHRDQLSFNYVITKTNIKIKWIEEKIFDNRWFDWKKHNTKRVIKKYRLYFGDENNYSFNNDIQNNYTIKDNIYNIKEKAPIKTDEIKIYPSNIGLITIRDIFLNDRRIEPIIKNAKKIKDFYLVYDKKPIIILNTKIQKNQIINIKLTIDILNNEEIAIILKQQSKIIDKKEEKIRSLEEELKNIYQSKSWKYVQNIRKILRK